jgi:hypothetical protein
VNNLFAYERYGNGRSRARVAAAVAIAVVVLPYLSRAVHRLIWILVAVTCYLPPIWGYPTLVWMRRRHYL